MNRNDFINLIKDIVISENNKRGKPLYPSVVIAQAILETGWGNSEIMMRANAIFGIKATSSWQGKVYNAKTKECYDGVSFTTINDCFRAYDSLEDSIKDYFNLICNSSRYRSALKTDSPEACITAIKNSGYATDPHYIDSVMRIIIENNLQEYDLVYQDTDMIVSQDVSQKTNYIVGHNYKLNVDLRVRAGAGTDKRIKNYNELTTDGKKHAYNQQKAVLKKGTVVTVLAVYNVLGGTWLCIFLGLFAGIYQNNKYVV